MAAVIRRKVSGRFYFYLEKTVRIGKKYKKFYEYFGSKKPSASELKKTEKRLQAKIRSFIEKEVVKPETEFIDAKTAKSLVRIKQETTEFLNGLSERQKKEWIEHEREKFITNTNAIEGSTLSLDETTRILRLNQRLGNEQERLEVLNMERCLKKYDEFLAGNQELSEKTILALHTILLNKIPNYDQYKGIWRPVNIRVRTSQFQFPPPQEVSSLMKETMTWYAEKKQFIHPVELAAKLHCQFTTVHPFVDGNGRIARLLLNYILQIHGFPFTNIPVSKRDEYFQTQEQGHHENYQPATQFLVKQIQENYKMLKKKTK